MRTGRPKQPLTLTEEERDRLQSLVHRARTAWLIPFVMLLPMRFWRRTGCRSFAASARA